VDTGTINSELDALSLHETMELHEIINFQTISVMKSKLFQGVVFDQDLKALLDKNVKMSMLAITQLQNLLGAPPMQ